MRLSNVFSAMTLAGVMAFSSGCSTTQTTIVNRVEKLNSNNGANNPHKVNIWNNPTNVQVTSNNRNNNSTRSSDSDFSEKIHSMSTYDAYTLANMYRVFLSLPPSTSNELSNGTFLTNGELVDQIRKELLKRCGQKDESNLLTLSYAGLTDEQLRNAPLGCLYMFSKKAIADLLLIAYKQKWNEEEINKVTISLSVVADISLDDAAVIAEYHETKLHLTGISGDISLSDEQKMIAGVNTQTYLNSIISNMKRRGLEEFLRADDLPKN